MATSSYRRPCSAQGVCPLRRRPRARVGLPIGCNPRTLALHVARHAGRGKAAQPALDGEEVQLDRLVADLGDPELCAPSADSRRAFGQAFRDAFRRLTAEQRYILRANILGRVTIETLGLRLGTSRAAAGRRIQQARQALAQFTREALVSRLRASESEIDELMRFVLGRPSLQLSAFLDTTRDGSAR